MARATAARLSTGATDDARVDGDHAVLVGEQRIEVELAHLRQVGASCASLTSISARRRSSAGGHVAVGLEQARHPRARDQVARELQVERRQRQRLVVDDLDRRAAAARTR